MGKLLTMACFVAPLVQAIATTAYRKLSKKPVPASVNTLEKMLWGGSIMLIVDHAINGELTWQFPFFTALSQAGGAAQMWKEILTVGVPMCLVITAVWAVWALLARRRKAAASA